MSRSIFPDLKLLSAASANGVSLNPISVGDYRHIVVAVTISAGFAGGTLKFEGSLGRSPATFSAAASVSNQKGYVAAKNLADLSTVVGATGLALTTPGTFLLEINTNGLMWLSAELASVTGAGTVTANVTGFDSNN